MPDFVLMVPEVEPLFAMLPETDPVEPKAVLPVSTSLDEMSTDPWKQKANGWVPGVEGEESGVWLLSGYKYR